MLKKLVMNRLKKKHMMRASRLRAPLSVGLLLILGLNTAVANELAASTKEENSEDLLSLGLEELLNTPVEVWSATKTKTTTDEAPSVITVITRQEMETWSYRSLADALKHVVGFYVVDDHILPNLGVRGFAGGLLGESGTIKLMIDGRSIAFRATSGNWLGTELIPLTAIERIEIIRGPVSALYGADAFLAIVNIITRKGENIDGVDGNGHVLTNSQQNWGGGFDTSLGTSKGKLDVLVSAKFDQEDRSGLKLPESSPAPSVPTYNEDATAARSMVLNSKVAFIKLGYQVNEKHHLTLMGYLSGIERGAEFNAWAPLSYGYNNSGVFSQSTVSLYNSIIGLSYSGQLTKAFQLDAKIHYFTGGPRDNDRIEVGSPVYYIRRDFGYNGVDGSIEGRWFFKDRVTLVLGTEMLFDRENLPSTLRVLKASRDDYATGDILTNSSNRQGTANFLNFGAFSQAIMRPIVRYLSIIAGMRYDRHNVYGSQLSSRLAAVTNPATPLYIKILYGSAYKAPSPLLLHASPYEVGDVVGNDALKPQFVHSLEGNVALKFDHFSFTTGVAYNLLTDKAEFVQQGVNRTAVNLSEKESISLESEIKAGYKEYIKGFVSSEVQLTRRNLDMVGYQAQLYGSKNVIYPPYIFRGGISGRVVNSPLAGTINAIYVGPRRSSDMNSLENFEAYDLSSYLLLGASLSVKNIELLKARNTTFTLSARNILGTAGPDPGFTGIDYPLAGRTFFLDIRQEL